jgi:hypothetical protein
MLTAMLFAGAIQAAEVLVEAEAFAERGGWLIDPQFMDQMGSPYLLAHGLGNPVANAKTEAEFPEAGSYHMWVRAKDWVPVHHPGRFKVLVNGRELTETFGASGRDWSWQTGGQIEVATKKVTIELRDLTGFEGRCDAIYFTTDRDTMPPENANEKMAAWRRKLLGLPETPAEAGQFDLVVVGGGVAGTCAAVSAARLGLHVALVQERPVLGGNASSEIGISPWAGVPTPCVDEMVAKLRQDKPFAAEKNLQIFFNMHACTVEKKGTQITTVIASHTITGQRMRFTAPLFVDCTGDGWIGFRAGADYRQGRESYREFNESLAPNEADKQTHGNTVIFKTKQALKPVSFPDVPWATTVSKDYAQMANIPDRKSAPDFFYGYQNFGIKIGQKSNRDLDHFWEYGQGLDTLQEAEHIRDHLFRAIYGTFATVKTKYPEAANLQLDWVGHIAARGESRRFIGDYTLNQNDAATGRIFPDAAFMSPKGFFCLHYIQSEYNFRGGAPRPAAETAGRGPLPKPTFPDEPLPACVDKMAVGKCVGVPFRCLYSRNIENLLLAGRCASATHVAAMNIKAMKIGGQMGVAVGTAAFLCKKYDTLPRGVYQKHLAELQDIVFERGEHKDALKPR